MAGDKTAVERSRTKREPIGCSKISLNQDSVHPITRSNKHEEQQNNSIHIKYLENSWTSQLRERQFGLYYRERNRARSNGLARLNEMMYNVNHFSS